MQVIENKNDSDVSGSWLVFVRNEDPKRDSIVLKVNDLKNCSSGLTKLTPGSQ